MAFVLGEVRVWSHLRRFASRSVDDPARRYQDHGIGAAYKDIDVGVSVHPEALFKEVGRHDIPFSADDAEEDNDYLAKHSVSVLPLPPYSSDIAPCDFFFFPKLKMTLKGRRFSLSSEVIENATVELNKLRKIEFELAFQQLFSR
ncbi:hypothetical protein LAZ67_3002161 [Cordylochernes scorpioides]|uniref:Transposase n=1 Tax=Cordylochernes scorpioides TaxID=51811 RepID=A0ABY6K8J5_9ARAC|nr:hypothetical protein LAZ67_3002161 [Cordylochernes scorpioides]